MFQTLRNFFHVIKRFKLAVITNLIGLSLAFLSFMLIKIHVDYEYGFDSSIANREQIFQLENRRNDGVWESNFSRPQLERFIAASLYIEAAAITNNAAYSSFDIGASSSSGPDAVTYLEKIERINPGYVDVFKFDIIAGNTDCLQTPDNVLISETQAKRFFGEEDPIGKPIFLTEFKDLNTFSIFGLSLQPMVTVGGVYRDFPENTRLKNAAYTAIPEREMMEDWYTGAYYCYLLLSSPEQASMIAEQYMNENAEFLKAFAIEDIRLRPISELYFGEQVRADAAPTGNKMKTNMLLFISILVIIMALVNYVNLSVALAPMRIKSINTQKILGSSQFVLQKNLLLESFLLSSFAFIIALFLVYFLKDNKMIEMMLGHSLNLSSNWMTLIWTALLAMGTGIIAGIYPAFYITSFPPAMAISGSFSLTDRAKITRKILIASQYVISIALVIGALFVVLQNKFIEKIDLGYEKDNILEVKISIGTALVKNELYHDLLLEDVNIKDVAFNENKFVSDESKATIGYTYRGEHSYMCWRGVSSNFPEVMGVQILAGRDFRAEDELQDNGKAVCMINETAAKEIISRFPKEEIRDISDLVGTSIIDNNIPVKIVGVFKDFHFESLYKEVRPFGLWVSAKNSYRRYSPENYSYVKIAGGDPQSAIDNIRKVTNELNPGYPVEIQLFDQALNNLYKKSQSQGLMVTFFCMFAVLLSLIGVFGLVIFESQGREKEIAVRKVFGATIQQIFWMFNYSFIKVVIAGFILAVPIAYYGVSQWLRSFAYKTPMYVWVFFVALILIALLTALTVTFQSYRAAIANPSEKLHR